MAIILTATEKDPLLEAEACSYGASCVVSPRTPTAITKRLQEALVAAQKDPAYEESLAKMGASTGELGPESFGELIKKDAAKWKAVIVAAGIKFD